MIYSVYEAMRCVGPSKVFSVPLANTSTLRELIKKKNESMDFVQRGGRGQTPNPNFFGLHFGSIEIKSGDGLGRLIPIFGSKL